jgi:hypothetical protein
LRHLLRLPIKGALTFGRWLRRCVGEAEPEPYRADAPPEQPDLRHAPQISGNIGARTRPLSSEYLNTLARS